MLRCSRCGNMYSRKDSLQNHIRNTHPDIAVPVKQPKPQHCPICDFKSRKRVMIEDHLSDTHQIPLSYQLLVFDSRSQFHEWKKAMENESNTMYAQQTGVRQCGDKSVGYYYCHRSGLYRRTGDSIRATKRRGSAKTDRICPSKIRMVENKDGTIEVTYLDTHVGHLIEARHLPLTKDDRKMVAEKIADGIPFDEILEELRNSFVGGGRLRLLNQKDLLNIQQSYNLYSRSVKRRTKDVKVMCYDPEPDKQPSKYIKLDNTNVNEVEMRHLKALELLSSTVVVNCKETGFWNVLSTEDSQRVQLNCIECTDCTLMCEKCAICAHKLTCSCPENIAYNNMCEHIHLVGLKLLESSLPQFFEDMTGEQLIDDTFFIPDYGPNAPCMSGFEMYPIGDIDMPVYMDESFVDEKRELRAMLDDILRDVTSVDQLVATQNALQNVMLSFKKDPLQCFAD